MAHYELIVIGAGPGGYEAALHAAKLGKKVAVVEKREAGGTCLNRGCIPTKTLLHSSQIFHDAKHGAHAGLHTDDIRADMTEIFAYKREISQKLSSGIESLFKTAKLDFLRSTALITAPGAVRVTDAEGGANDYTCDDILIATGSVPSRPPIPGLEIAMTSDALLEGCAHLNRSVDIIGGGVNGPIIYFSVRWWNTRHQGASITTSGTSMAKIMLYTLLVMVAAGMFYGAGTGLSRTRTIILERDRRQTWAQ